MERAPEYITREDKLASYLERQTQNYVFDELSDAYLDANQLDFLKGVALPFKPEDLVHLSDGGIHPAKMADNMAMVMGSNIHFPYAGVYLRYLARYFSDKLIGVFTSNGAQAMMDGQFRKAVTYYRMALLLDSKDLMAMFGYACACREWYLSLEGEDGVDELIVILKQEATEYYEWCIIEHPSFAPSYYYLGFAYLNAALYGKAQFIWKRFVELSEDKKDKAEYLEIMDRLAELEDPVRIEEGINKLTIGELEGGLKILEPYVDSQYGNWWPLHFYLACTYRELEHPMEAIEGFKKVLALSPSNGDACKALAEIYEELGDEENAKKYQKKSEILLQNQSE